MLVQLCPESKAYIHEVVFRLEIMADNTMTCGFTVRKLQAVPRAITCREVKLLHKFLRAFVLEMTYLRLYCQEITGSA